MTILFPSAVVGLTLLISAPAFGQNGSVDALITEIGHRTIGDVPHPGFYEWFFVPGNDYQKIYPQSTRLSPWRMEYELVAPPMDSGDFGGYHEYEFDILIQGALGNPNEDLIVNYHAHRQGQCRAYSEVGPGMGNDLRNFHAKARAKLFAMRENRSFGQELANVSAESFGIFNQLEPIIHQDESLIEGEWIIDQEYALPPLEDQVDAWGKRSTEISLGTRLFCDVNALSGMNPFNISRAGTGADLVLDVRVWK